MWPMFGESLSVIIQGEKLIYKGFHSWPITENQPLDYELKISKMW